MSTVVVGGSGRGVGKTALVCGIIAAYPVLRWTAVKITAHPHGMPEPIWEEVRGGQGTDTARYLAAGARRALLVTALGDEFPLRALQGAIGSDAHVIFESNRVLAHLQPDVCIGVLDGSRDDFKPSFEAFLQRVDVLVRTAGADTNSFNFPVRIPLFLLDDPGRISPEMHAWLQPKISPSQ